MSQTLTLPNETYTKLSRGAAQRGLTVQSLLAFVSELVAPPKGAGEQDRKRSRRIERLLERYRAGSLTARDRAQLDALIDADYEQAIARADRLIVGQKQGKAKSSRK
jgi:hypothetical protein